MKKFGLLMLAALFMLSLSVVPAQSQLIFRKAFQEKHTNVKTVSCYACHKRGKDADGNLLGKEHRNEFGTALEKALEGKKATDRINEAKTLGDDEKQAVYDAVTKDFMEALEKVEKQKAGDGKTWLDHIKAADIDGLTAE